MKILRPMHELSQSIQFLCIFAHRIFLFISVNSINIIIIIIVVIFELISLFLLSFTSQYMQINFTGPVHINISAWNVSCVRFFIHRSIDMNVTWQVKVTTITALCIYFEFVTLQLQHKIWRRQVMWHIHLLCVCVYLCILQSTFAIYLLNVALGALSAIALEDCGNYH